MGNCLSQNQIRKDMNVSDKQPGQKVGKQVKIQKAAQESTRRERQNNRELVSTLEIKVQTKRPQQRKTDQSQFQHADNPHNQMFKITPTPAGTKIVFNNFYDTNCYNCVKREAIAANSVVGFKIKQTSTLKQHVLIGVASESIIKNPKNWTEAVVYSSSSGQLWEGGSWQPKGHKMIDGEVIKIQVDTKTWIINWEIDDSRKWTTQILQKMKDKQLFLVLMMHDKNDTIELLH